MKTLMLFGLRIAPLFDAIAAVESDRGATSDNIFQIRRVYVDDVNRIAKFGGITRWAYADVTNRDEAEKMMLVYWSHYGYEYVSQTGQAVTYQVLARIHNGGPRGWKKESTKAYWAKVKAAMDAQGKAVAK